MTISPSIRRAEENLQTLLPGVYRGRTEEIRPISMGSAPLAFDLDGNVAWDLMWGSFCDLAMAGGPPHKGKLLEPCSPEAVAEEPVRYAEVCKEIERGIGLAARLQVAPSTSPGWLRVRCSNQTMAEWLLRAITMENVSVRLEGDSILLPAGPAYRIEKEIKNVVTVAAKASHYWSSHLHRLQQIGIANVFSILESEAPLLQPAWNRRDRDATARARIESELQAASGLRPTTHGYSNWIGLDVGSVGSAIITMRRLVASNILCRREETTLFLPVNAEQDPEGLRLTRSLTELLERNETIAPCEG